MTRTKKPELLSPAGNPEKLRFAVDYGADAVYCALNDFGMRASAGNFSIPELGEGIAYAHARNALVYCTFNTMPRDGSFPHLRETLVSLSDAGVRPDAFIVSDPGVAEYIRRYIKDPVLHLSTQTSTVNSEAVKFWYRQGFKRVVLARELSLAEIKTIRQSIPPEAELECFIHGAMCVSYSGRCLLSNYYTGRNSNEGRCAQPCRWKYYLSEEKRGESAVAEQDESGTYIFSSRDMRMIGHIGELCEAGIDSFKIEGRMKSAYYTAAVTNAYRIAMDDYFESRPFDDRCERETDSVSHREYGTGYYFSSPCEDANTVNVNEYLSERPFLALVTGYDRESRLASCVQRSKMCIGDRVNILSPGGFGTNIIVDRLYDGDMQPITDTRHPGMNFYIETDSASAGDIIRGAK